MNLPGLVLALRPLLGNPRTHWKQIVALLSEHATLAEYEVARHLVTRAVEPTVGVLLRSVDPRERLRGIDMLALTYARSAATRALRVLAKDPHPRVRARARRAAERLMLTDVALPDLRNGRAKSARPFALGGWNATGWRAGLVDPSLPHRARAQKASPAAALAARAKLPELPDAHSLVALVGASDEAALRRLMRPGAAPGAPYIDFEVPKATGGTRVISAPRARLKAAQRVILRAILAHLPLHDAAHGFVPGRSVLTNARPHVGAALVVKTDLRDFFPSVHYRRVVGLFEQYGFAPEVAALLAGLTTHRRVLPDGTVAWPSVLPQGAPTSPAIANLVCRRLDARLEGLARSMGAVYTRYADDLTFSFRTPPRRGLGRFFWWVDQVCQQEGFEEHAAKRRVLRPSAQQRVAGVVVNSGLFVPREARRRFRAILTNCRRHGVASQARGRPRFREYLLGYAAYVRMVQPALGEGLVREVHELLHSEPPTRA